MGLAEDFRLYNAPASLAMGGAYVADATGYLSNYYNPAGLAKAPKKKIEVTPIDLEGIGSLVAAGLDLSAHSFGIYRLMDTMKHNVGKYNYFAFSSAPGFSMRGFAFSPIATYQYAALSEGDAINIDASETYGATFGGAVNLLGNCLKLGITGKALLRNQLKSEYAYRTLSSDDAIASLMKEGIGIGADIGFMLTVPNKYLPTLGIVWKDIFNTHFYPTHILNSLASGAPDSLRQTVNIAASLHPHLGRGWRATIAIEVDGVQHKSVGLLKRSHLGVQLESDRSLYFWLGLNQIYPTGGIGYRVKGGTLEVGTYAEDYSETSTLVGDRRFFFRYTIGF